MMLLSVTFPSLSSSFQRVSEREEKTSFCLFVFVCIDRRAERKEMCFFEVEVLGEVCFFEIGV
jgi:hypothetical protein